LLKRVVIVGGGITGLAAAHALEKAAERCEVRLLEGAPHLGGNLQTIRHNGFIIDAGPDAWLAARPHATRLVKDIGLGDEIIESRPDARRVYVVWQRKLHPLPEALTAFAATELRPLLESELLGWDAKIRAGLDVVVPAHRWKDDDDESVGAFVARRLGAEVAERVAEPVLGALYAGNADALSIRAAAPQLVEAEKEHGSLVRAMAALRAKRRGEPTSSDGSSTFLSLKRGVGDLVLNLAHKLRDAEVFPCRPASAIEPLPEGDARGRWLVATDDGPLYADDVAVVVPASAAAALVAGFDPELAAMCSAIEFASTATLFLAYRKFDVRHPLDASGFLVPRAENRPIRSCGFVSSKWDHRAPAGQVLLRILFGGAGGASAILENDDDELVRIARAQVLDLLGIDRAPMFSKVFRFPGGSPQPHVGHVRHVRKLLVRAHGHPGLHLGGSGYLGFGISEAIRLGEEIAARISPPAPV
jgi:oxygen-dependent protoporphyrinogen oxidase